MLFLLSMVATLTSEVSKMQKASQQSPQPVVKAVAAGIGAPGRIYNKV
jgi:hypothetical protein